MVQAALVRRWMDSMFVGLKAADDLVRCSGRLFCVSELVWCGRAEASGKPESSGGGGWNVAATTCD